jgi:hypothetical protein
MTNSVLPQTYCVSTSQLNKKNLDLIGRFVGRRFSSSKSNSMVQKISQQAHRSFELLKWVFARYLGMNVYLTLHADFKSLQLENTEYQNVNEILGAMIANKCTFGLLNAISREIEDDILINQAMFLNLVRQMSPQETNIELFSKLKVNFETDLMAFLKASLEIKEETKLEIIEKAVTEKNIDFNDAVEFINTGQNVVKKKARIDHLLTLGFRCPTTYKDKSGLKTVYGEAISKKWGKDVILLLRELAPFDFQGRGLVSDEDIRCFKRLLGHIVDSVESDNQQTVDNLCEVYKDVFMNETYKEKVSAALFSLETVSQLVSNASKPQIKNKSKRKSRRRKKPVVNFEKGQNMLNVLINYGCDLSSFVNVENTKTERKRLGHALMLNLIKMPWFLSKSSKSKQPISLLEHIQICMGSESINKIMPTLFSSLQNQVSIPIEPLKDHARVYLENTILLKKLIALLGTNALEGTVSTDAFVEFLNKTHMIFNRDDDILSILKEPRIFSKLNSLNKTYVQDK